MIKIGIIGLGHMGCFHASVCSQISSVKFIGIADPNEKNWEKIKNKDILKVKDYRGLLPLVDAVIIAVPTDLHYLIAKECLNQGKHILLEKPLTKTLEQAQELFILAANNNLALHVGHVERFNGAVQELKKIINEPYLIECHRMGPFSARVQNDSVILDLMIHDLDIVLNLINSPIKKINLHGNKIHTTSCDIAAVTITFENGALASIISSRASQIKKRTMNIHQKDAFISLDFATQDIAIHKRASTSVNIGLDALTYKQESTIEHLFVYKDNPLKQEVEYFVDSIVTKKHLINAAQDLTALDITFKLEQELGLR